MKTYKKLWKQLCSLENLILAFNKAKKGKSKKAYVAEFESNLIQNLAELQKELIEKTYIPKPIVSVIIHDPKTRKIGKASFRDRVVHHALINILNPIFEPIFIYDNYASRKKKGHHKALERFNYFLRKVSFNGKKLKGIKNKNYICGYVLKADIKKYFENVDHEILLRILEEKIEDKDVLWLVRIILEYGNNSFVKRKGMPLGNYTSQFFANVFLNKLDYFVKQTLRAKYYLRYVDDFVILNEDKEKLERYKIFIDDFLHSMGLRLHPDKSKVLPLHNGVSLLGFRNFYHCRLLKKSCIRQIERNIKIWKEKYAEEDYEKICSRLQGWLAHAEHGNTYYLRKRIVAKFNQLFLK